MLDRLVGWAVLAIAHSIVGKNENSGQFHEGREPDRRADMITEYEKRCAESPELGKRQPVDDCSHRVFTDSKMDVLTAWSRCFQMARSWVNQGRLVR